MTSMSNIIITDYIIAGVITIFKYDEFDQKFEKWKGCRLNFVQYPVIGTS